MKKITILNFCIIVIVIVFFIAIPTYAVVNETQGQQALVNTARAFYYRGKNIQYDAQPVTCFTANYVLRDDLFYTPEEAVGNDTYYTFCSTFIWKIYANAFTQSGKPFDIANYLNEKLKFRNKVPWWGNVLPYDFVQVANPNYQYYDSKIAVYYNNDLANMSANEKNTVIQNLKPGDIISYFRYYKSNSTRGGTYGHTIMYYGNNRIVQSFYTTGGGVYNFSNMSDNKEKKGSISITELNSTINYYISQAQGKSEEEGATYFSVIRPLNYIKNEESIQLSTSAEGRSEYPRLIIEKTADKSKYTTVNTGDTITYSIKLTNSGDQPYSLNIEDVIPENTTYKESNSAESIVSEGKVYFKNINLSVGQSRTFSYTVIVNNDKSLFDKYIECSGGNVGKGNYKIELNPIYTPVGISLTSEQQIKMKNISKSLSADTYENVQAYIKNVYKAVGYCIDLEDLDTEIKNIFTIGDQKLVNDFCTENNLQAAINSYYDSGKMKTPYIIKKDLTYKEKYVNGLYGGGYSFEVEPSDFNDRIRTRGIKVEDFTIGDILIVNDSGDTPVLPYNPAPQNIYIYCGDGVFKTVNSNGNVETYSPSSAEPYNTERFVDSLFAKENFVVLRPSLAEEKYSVDDNYYATLEDAYNAITSQSGTINVEISGEVIDYSELTIKSDKTITINTNGNTIIKMAKGITNNGTLIINGGGTITTSAEVSNNEIHNLITNNGTLTLENVIIENKGMSSNYTIGILSNMGIVNVNKGAVVKYYKEIESGVIYSNRAIAMNGNSNVIVDGGIVSNNSGLSGYAIYGRNGSGTLTIKNGGTITSSRTAIELYGDDGGTSSANVHMYDGTITSTGGYGILLNKNSNSSNTGLITIEGGEIFTYTSAAILSYSSGTISVSNSDTSIRSRRNAIELQGTGNFVVTGGYISGIYNGIINQGTGTITISGTLDETRIYSLMGNVINNGGTATVIIKGGTLESDSSSSSCIYNPNGKIIIGENNDNVSQTVPILRGLYGVGTSNETEFYDGILKGITEAIMGGSGKVKDVPENYIIVNGEEVINETKYKTMFLTQKIRGDVNCDGFINILDVRLLLQKVINSSYTEDEMNIVDFNQDSEVTIIDVRMLLQYILNN